MVTINWEDLKKTKK